MNNNEKIVLKAYTYYSHDAYFNLEICKKYGYNKVTTRSLLC